jgi:hypothetical protein
VQGRYHRPLRRRRFIHFNLMSNDGVITEVRRRDKSHCAICFQKLRSASARNKNSVSALLILGTLAGFIQLLDGGVGLLHHDLGKSIGPLFIAVLQFCAMYLLSRSARNSAE